MAGKVFGIVCNAMSSPSIPKGCRAYILSINKQGSQPAVSHIACGGKIVKDLLRNYKNFRIAAVPFEVLQAAQKGSIPQLFPLHTSRKYQGFREVMTFLKQETTVQPQIQGEQENGDTEEKQ